MKKLTKDMLLRAIILVCAAAFLICNLYLLSEQTLRGNALPMPFGVGAAIVLSGSMEPALSVDDLIIVAAAHEYAPGEIVVYQSGDALVVHRIMQIADGCAITQGDANNTPDDPVALAQIKGRVVAKLSGVGGLVRTVRSPAVSFVLMALAIFLLERSFRREKQLERDEIAKMEEEIARLKQQTQE